MTMFYGDTGLRIYQTMRSVRHIAYFNEGTGEIACLTHDDNEPKHSGWITEIVAIDRLTADDLKSRDDLLKRIRDAARFEINGDMEIVRAI